jgi:hypothetical protein
MKNGTKNTELNIGATATSTPTNDLADSKEMGSDANWERMMEMVDDYIYGRTNKERDDAVSGKSKEIEENVAQPKKNDEGSAAEVCAAEEAAAKPRAGYRNCISESTPSANKVIRILTCRSLKSKTWNVVRRNAKVRLVGGFGITISSGCKVTRRRLATFPYFTFRVFCMTRTATVILVLPSFLLIKTFMGVDG